MVTQNFRVIFEPEKDGGYHAYCPTLRGCHSYGETLDEAKKNIAEAIEAYLESLAKHGEEIPVEQVDEQVIATVRVSSPKTGRLALA
ncbi:MAG: type II toxin-antitoxin system HicB family antitoxin [Patescibacteria group bacterium]